MARYLEDFAARFGIQGLARHERMPNTRKALAVAERARDRGRLHPLRRAVMNAYWLGGRDLEDDGVLADCAREAGLDPGDALAAIDDPACRARVDAMGEEAWRDGITGIPTLLVGEDRVVGCQPYEVIEAAVKAAGGSRR